MPVWRLQTTIGADSLNARDRYVITPHFNDSGVTTDPDGLCEALATALATYIATPREIVVRAYDAQGTKPVNPQGEAIRNAGLFPATAGIREVALCLSFYSQFNRKRQRGRLYIPTALVSSSSTFALRPTTAQMQRVADLVPIFTSLGGIDVDWCIYSRLDDEARPVTHWYVDDEWDIVRSRGLRPLTRLAGTTSEG